MRFRLRPEGLDFLATAPRRFVFEAEVAAPRPAVFGAISADPSTWTWFPGLSWGGYEGPPPHGVGAIREVRVGGTSYRETILAWDEPTRWAYRVDASSAPVARALVEDWAVDDVDHREDRTVVRWTFAIDPRVLFRLGLPAADQLMGRLFRRAMGNLSGQLSAERAN